MIINYAPTCRRYLPERLFFAHPRHTHRYAVCFKRIDERRETRRTRGRYELCARSFFLIFFFCKTLVFLFQPLWSAAAAPFIRSAGTTERWKSPAGTYPARTNWVRTIISRENRFVPLRGKHAPMSRHVLICAVPCRFGRRTNFPRTFSDPRSHPGIVTDTRAFSPNGQIRLVSV